MKKFSFALLTTTLLMTLAAKAATFTLGTTFSTESAATGTNSVILAVTPSTSSWTASTNVSWLRLSSTNGTGSATVTYSFDANVGPTRTGTLTIAGQTLTVTQAGPSYVATSAVSNLVSSGLSFPAGLAIDGGGNVFISDYNNNAIKKWNVTNNTVSTLVSSNVVTPIKQPGNLALDSSGNVYFADSGNNAIKRWNVSSSTMTTLVSSNASTPLNRPAGVALDSAGNVYFADGGNNAVKKWTATNGAVTVLVSSELNNPTAVSVDAAGNVYIADALNNAIKKWSVADSSVTTVVSNGLVQPIGVMVDGSGNLIIADSGNQAIKVWSVVSNTLSTKISTGLANPFCAEVDANGSLYIADSGNNLIKKAPDAFVDTATVSVSPAAGSGTLSAVLPVTESLRAPFVPTSDAAWLTVNGATNGVVTFSFTTNLGSTRTGNITVLGRKVPIRQAIPTYALGTTNITQGAAATNDAVTLSANYSWSATANAAWLHLSATNGTGSTNLIFAIDANAGATRTGTLTIAGQTLTVTQVGTNYVAVNSLYTLVSGLSSASGIAVDGSGNVYISDSGADTLQKWTASSGTVSTLVSSGANMSGIALDSAGNVYMADDLSLGAVKKWTAANNTVTTIVSNGLSFPNSVAVDGAGNIYIVDNGNNALKQWTAANNTVNTLVSSGLNNPIGVDVDVAGNVYIADSSNNAIKKWAVADNSVSPLISSGLSGPVRVVVDGSGNLYFGDSGHSAIKQWSAATGNLATLIPSVVAPTGVAVDSARNLYVSDGLSKAVRELPRAWVDSTAKTESGVGGSDVLPAVQPTTINLSGIFAPTSDASWLTITGVANGVVGFSFTANNTKSSRTAHITLLGQSIAVSQTFNNALGTTNLVEGPTAGMDSVVLMAASNWTATANASWLHLSAANQSGTGSTNVIFTFDANPGATRTGTLTIGGITLSITQAAASYVAASPFIQVFSTTNLPYGVTVDNVGNVYAANRFYDSAVTKWTATNNTISTLISSGLARPQSLAADSAGNIFIADTDNGAIQKWMAANQTLIPIVTSGLSSPQGVAVDSDGNVYIANAGFNGIAKWTAANDTTTTLVGSGLFSPTGVAVDAAGNVYIADTFNNAIKKWTAANNTVSTLVSSGLSHPFSVAVDGSGNVFISDTENNVIKKWTAATGAVTTPVPTGLVAFPRQIAVDASGTLYIANVGASKINEMPQAWVDTTAVSKSPDGGSDVLPVILPATLNLSGPMMPTSDAAWLTITGVTNGVVSYSFTTNSGGPRVAHLTILGQTIAVTQGNYSYSLGSTNLVEPASSGSDGVVLKASHDWTATANDSWLHLSAPNQSGSVSTNVIFTFDANPGATRTGTLTIAGVTVTVTQAGSTYVAASTGAALVSTGVNNPSGPSVDAAGNMFFADTLNNAIKKWNLSNNVVTTVVSSGLSLPSGTALDGTGNIYIVDSGNNAIKMWSAANSNVTTLVSTGLSSPQSAAVDAAGNVYIADTGNNAVKKWTATNSSVTTLISSGLNSPQGVAVDAAGNVYVADKNNMVVKEWIAANSNVVTRVSAPLGPKSVTVDGSGNVYFANQDNSIQRWAVASNSVSNLFSGVGIATGSGLALDGARNIYFSFPAATGMYEQAAAYVDPTSRPEPASSGSDVLPAVLPATENLLAPFAPTSDAAWLTITGVTNGVVSFSYSANTNASRTGHITLLGQSIAVVQGAPFSALATTTLLEGASAGMDSVVLAANIDWTATAGAAWLHVLPVSQSGKGSTNVVFSFDSNPGETRTGTITIAGITLTVTQAGVNYLPVNPVVTLVSTGPPGDDSVAVNEAGDVYYIQFGSAALHKWTLTNNSTTDVVTSGLTFPSGVAVDADGNAYIADAFGTSVKKWTASSGVLTTLIFGLSQPNGVAVDKAGNVYITDNGNDTVKKWAADTQTLTTLASNLPEPVAVAVDFIGNVYFADDRDNSIKVWRPESQAITTLISGIHPAGVAVDPSGNIYFSDYANGAIKKRNAIDGSVTSLIPSGLSNPHGVALDKLGNLYFAEYTGYTIKEQPRAFVDLTPKSEPANAGSDVLPVILPVTQNLLAPFAPNSDSPWLTINGVTNGVVRFAFTANVTSSPRTGYINVLGQFISVTQSGLVTAPILTSVSVLTNGQFSFGFTNAPGVSFTVLTSTNLAIPMSSWTVLGAAVEYSPGQYQFADETATNQATRFYTVRQP